MRMLACYCGDFLYSYSRNLIAGEDLPGFVTHEVDLTQKKKKAWNRRSRMQFSDPENDEFECQKCAGWFPWFYFALGQLSYGSSDDTYDTLSHSVDCIWPCDSCMEKQNDENLDPLLTQDSDVDAFMEQFSGDISDVVLTETVAALKDNSTSFDALRLAAGNYENVSPQVTADDNGSWLRRPSSTLEWQCFKNEDEFCCVACKRWRPWFHFAKGQEAVHDASYARHHAAWVKGQMWDCDDCMDHVKNQANAMVINNDVVEVQPSVPQEVPVAQETIYHLDPIAAMTDVGACQHEGEYELVLSDADLFWCFSQKTCQTIVKFADQCGKPISANDIPSGIFFNDALHCQNSHLFAACNGKSLLGLYSDLTITDSEVLKKHTNKLYPVYGVNSRQMYLKSYNRFLKGDSIGIITGELKEINVLDQVPDDAGQWPAFIAGNPTSRHAYQVVKTNHATKGGVVWYGLYNYDMGNKFRYLSHSELPNCEVILQRVYRRFAGPYYEFVLRATGSICAHTRLSIDKTIRYLPLGFFKNSQYTTERLIPTCTLDPAEI